MSIRTRLITGVIAASLAGGAAWIVQGWRYDAQIAVIERNQATALSTAQAAARKKEREYAELYARVDGQYLELAVAQLEAADLRAAVAAGDKRLSVRTAPGACSVSSNSGTTGMGHEAPRADIDPGDAGDIIAILARGDEAIRQLNGLQDWWSMMLGGD
ncbi:MAG: lysis protein [Burkholderiaceae bacterium]|nr:lysis protein [Burkholderiaceae bacterium]